MRKFLFLCAILSLAFGSASAVTPPEPNTLVRTWQGIPGLERTAKGRVFISWFSGGTREPEPENTVLLCYSDDGGNTYTAPMVMGAPQDGSRCFDPVPWIDPRGRLWYFFNRGNKTSGQHGVYARICDQPDAPTPVFGPEFRVGFDCAYSFRMNKPIILSTGEWILPVTFINEPVFDWVAGKTPDQQQQLQGVGISRDEGKSWELRGAVASPPWALEGMVTELKDGGLWMLIRTGSGFLWQSHSADKGLTWSKGEPTKIKNPGSRFFIRRLASGNLLLVNHYKYTHGRDHLTAQVSTDDGKSWNNGLLLDERQFISYPDGVQDRDGLIWITYDRDRRGSGDILMAKFTEKDAVEGNDVSGKTLLKQVIDRLREPTQ